MSDLPAALAADLADRYAIERELGRGGMATVYLALDLKHGRKVALKVFRPEIAAALGVERFVREIEIAARLQHPHILGLHDSGTAGGLLYYVMPYVEGISLRQRMQQERQLPIDEVVRLTGQIAQALAYAHARGIVHRDIKPENILLSSNTAIVADFGIARAMAEAGGEKLTGTGISLGTPTYMSPEQGMGGPLDGRSDIYSLACVVYEMLGGEPPFAGGNSQALLARHSVDPVPRLRTLRQTVTPAMEAVIERALAKAPADRQASVTEFAEQLAESARVTAGRPALAVARTRSRRVSWVAAGAAAVAAVVGALLIAQLRGRSGAAPGGRPRLAVLPFESIGQPEDQYVADGMADEITSRVAGMSGLAVIARSSTRSVKSGSSPREVGKQLQVQYVLTGSVRTERGGGPNGAASVRVTPQLIRADDEEVLWQEEYNASLAPGELLELQSVIADSVARKLNVSLLATEKLELAARPTDNLAAYEAYLRGNVYAAQLLAEEPGRKAVEQYQRAVDADPRFAAAWAKLAEAHTQYYFYFDRTEQRLAQARAALERAAALDSTLLEGHLARGLLHYLGALDYQGAEREFNLVLRGRPNDSQVLYYLANIQRRKGQFDEAAASFRRAAELDPRSQIDALELAITHLMRRQFPAAQQELDRAIALAPDWLAAHVTRSFLFWAWKGDLEKARAAMREALRTHSMREVLTYLLLLNPQYVLTLGAEFQDSLDAVGPKDITIDPGFLYLGKGLSFKRRGDPRATAYFDSSRAVWEPRVRARPQEWRYHGELGLSYAGLGRREEALAEGRTAVGLLPLSRDAQGGNYPLTMMVTIAILTNELDTAMVYLRPLLENPSQITPAMLRHDALFAPLAGTPGFRQLSK